MVSVTPKGLPYLPGNSFYDPSNMNFKKSHIFDAANGIAVVNDNKIPGAGSKGPVPELTNPPVAPETMAPEKSGSLTAPVQPAWVAFDRKVLRFDAYFQEAVHESRQETFRIRRCVIYYYLEDDSIHVSEPKIENSGIPQGERKGVIFLKRHRIPKSTNDFYSLQDLNIGAQPNFYGRVFRLVDCDEFTRNFLDKIGVTVGEPEALPEDPYNKNRDAIRGQITQNQKYFHPRPHDDDLMRYMEAKLGVASTLLDREKLDQFLKNDRKVLRFYLAWDDREHLYGELRPFVLHYFLADDTIEVLEVRRANSGRDPFPLFLKRQKLPKEIDTLMRTDAPTTHTTQLIDRTGKVDPGTMKFYSETDLSVGIVLNIFNRQFLIYGCDEHTREYYKQVYSIEFEDIPVEFSESIERPQMEIPPYSGHGSEEDSLGSFLYLIPKVPKKNFRRMMENDRKVLRYMARLDTAQPEDVDRVFIIKYFLSDDTVSVYEPPQKNSGIVGGKFLERCRIKKPNANDYYSQSDFFTGAVVEFFKHTFCIFQADEYSLSYMESNPDAHPMSDIKYINDNLHPVVAEKAALLKGKFDALESAQSGSVSYDELRDALETCEIQLNDQALITILRRFDHDGSGMVSIEEFMAAFVAEVIAPAAGAPEVP